MLLEKFEVLFGIDVRILLSGKIDKNESEKGNMKNLKFYVCKQCGNIIMATSEAAVTCCGGKRTALVPRRVEETEMLKVEDMGAEWFISSDHEMTKEHYISFAV